MQNTAVLVRVSRTNCCATSFAILQSWYILPTFPPCINLWSWKQLTIYDNLTLAIWGLTLAIAKMGQMRLPFEYKNWRLFTCITNSPWRTLLISASPISTPFTRHINWPKWFSNWQRSHPIHFQDPGMAALAGDPWQSDVKLRNHLKRATTKMPQTQNLILSETCVGFRHLDIFRWYYDLRFCWVNFTRLAKLPVQSFKKWDQKHVCANPRH